MGANAFQARCHRVFGLVCHFLPGAQVSSAESDGLEGCLQGVIVPGYHHPLDLCAGQKMTGKGDRLGYWQRQGHRPGRPDAKQGDWPIEPFGQAQANRLTWLDPKADQFGGELQAGSMPLQGGQLTGVGAPENLVGKAAGLEGQQLGQVPELLREFQ